MNQKGLKIGLKGLKKVFLYPENCYFCGLFLAGIRGTPSLHPAIYFAENKLRFWGEPPPPSHGKNMQSSNLNLPLGELSTEVFRKKLRTIQACLTFDEFEMFSN